MQAGTRERRRTGKKKADLNLEKDQPEVGEAVHPPSGSEISARADEAGYNGGGRKDIPQGRHTPVFEKPPKTFSIKDIIGDEPDIKESSATAETGEPVHDEADAGREAFTAEAFEKCWPEFVGQLSGEGSRIISMFKAIKPEVEEDQTIRIHLSNATQKDTFVQNYKQRLISFLQSRFLPGNIDVETAVDNTETGDILYTDEQRCSYLFNKYPILKDMKKNFNLDLT